jgi:hypothetical protein
MLRVMGAYSMIDREVSWIYHKKINTYFLLQGDVAQMVERSLSMREVRGSIPRISMFFFVLPPYLFFICTNWDVSTLVSGAIVFFLRKIRNLDHKHT